MTSKHDSDKSFAERVLIVIGFCLLAFLLAILFYYTFDVLLLIFAAALLAIFLRGLSDVIGSFVKLSELARIIIVIIALVAVVGGAIALLAPSIAEQVAHLRDELPRSAAAAAAYISKFGWGKAILDQLPSIADVINSSRLLTSVGGIFTSTVGAVGNFFITLLLAVYFAISPSYYTDGFVKLFPIPNRKRVVEILSAIGETLRWWLIGKACSMLFIGLLTWIGLSILGVPLALTLGLIAGLLSFIPNFGPILSAVPAMLIAFVDRPITAVYVGGLFILVQLIESNIVTPLIEKETVELPPGLTIMFQLALAVLVGGLGLVLATPILAVVMALVQMVYIEDVLGDYDTEMSREGRDGNSNRKRGRLAEAAEETS
jgi:predicted PurR-regulated permease PerM